MPLSPSMKDMVDLQAAVFTYPCIPSQPKRHKPLQVQGCTSPLRAAPKPLTVSTNPKVCKEKLKEPEHRTVEKGNRLQRNRL